MWYAIEGYDAADSLQPCPAIDAEDPGPAGFSGSIVIAEFESLGHARAWADADPYVEAGVYARVEVRPFKAVLP
jgi:uncharacterized protein YciI